MKVNTNNAVKLFFSKPSLEMVYFEAVVNAIDANASTIDVKIAIDSYDKPETLGVEIKDNGDGFNDTNFEKFTKLLETKEKDHKGVGRLVFLHYFKKVSITSIYKHKERKFLFTESFDGDHKLLDFDGDLHETTLTFEGYQIERIKSYDYLKPESIKKSLLRHFFPLFHSLKVKNKDLKITISVSTKEPNHDHKFYPDSKEIVISQLPDLKEITFNDDRLDLFEKLTLHYNVKENIEDEPSSITAICVDNRTIHVDILAKNAVPKGYEIIFLLYSDLFTGRVNSSRQELAMEKGEINTLKKLFGDQVAKILKEQIPKIQERNKQVSESLKERYPHLTGYFEEESAGLIDRDQSLEIAQKRFFNAQKEILDSPSLSDDQYEKSLEVSSRLLTEYILYRNIIIEKLKKVNNNSSEADIHNIIVPMRKTFKNDNLMKDIYSNNAWLLDDKYMSYTTILSDEDMDKLVSELLIEGESVERDKTRPDIAIVFSSDPKETSTKLDVVIVELKKLGLESEKKEVLIRQLRKRARKLLNYYPSRIQRIWFYGVVDFDKDFIRSLKEEQYLEVFSSDSHYYKEIEIMPGYDENVKIPTAVNILSYDALIKDAEARNSTFLKLLKEGFKKESSE
ncbi:MAG: sensor histidine kinase [Ekhidna sp.]|nr:sensor histidine kinase [Ekhidna sp.]MBC6427374.1 sensor histidine kinase [Ekhidna sp.]